MRRIWAACVVALLFGVACSSSGDVDSSGESESATPIPSTTAESDDETTPVAPQPVTASTIHETRSDDFPDILAAQASPEDNGSWRFDVTVSSPYDTPQRYADAWRVVDEEGIEYGIRVLTHDHASEQPFTRSQGGIVIPDDVTVVIIEGRDQANGWGGGTLRVELQPGGDS